MGFVNSRQRRRIRQRQAGGGESLLSHPASTTVGGAQDTLTAFFLASPTRRVATRSIPVKSQEESILGFDIIVMEMHLLDIKFADDGTASGTVAESGE